jgi:hypothetical protein
MAGLVPAIDVFGWPLAGRMRRALGVSLSRRARLAASMAGTSPIGANVKRFSDVTPA